MWGIFGLGDSIAQQSPFGLLFGLDQQGAGLAVSRAFAFEALVSRFFVIICLGREPTPGEPTTCSGVLTKQMHFVKPTRSSLTQYSEIPK